MKTPTLASPHPATLGAIALFTCLGLWPALTVAATLDAPSAELPHAPSQEDSVEFWENYQRSTRRAIRQVKARFLEVLPPEERAILAATDVSLIKYANINAWSATEARKIKLPIGVIYMTDQMLQAILLVHQSDEPQIYIPQFQPYVNYLVDLNVEGERTGQPIAEVQTAWSFFGMDQATAARIMNRSQYRSLRERSLLDMIALVMGHELGHIVHADQGYQGLSQADSWRQEYAADDYAVKLVTRAGYSVMPGTMTYGLFAFLEGGTSRTHPPGVCRLVKMINVAIVAYETNEDSLASLQRAGMSIESLKAQIEQLRAACRQEDPDALP